MSHASLVQQRHQLVLVDSGIAVAPLASTFNLDLLNTNEMGLHVELKDLVELGARPSILTGTPLGFLWCARHR